MRVGPTWRMMIPLPVLSSDSESHTAALAFLPAEDGHSVQVSERCTDIQKTTEEPGFERAGRRKKMKCREH